MKTRIGKFDVPVKGRVRVIVIFEQPYVFWTAVWKRPVNGKTKLYGRAVVGLSAGDRFDRMRLESRAAHIPKEDRPIYAMYWRAMQGGANVSHVRPSTTREINRWMRLHPVQMKFFRKTVAL